MIKTNSRAFKEWLTTYILKNARNNETEEPFKNIEEALQTIADDFASQFCENDVRRCGSYQEAFINWASGLANPLFDYYLYQEDLVNMIGDVLQQTKEERAKYDEEDVSRLLSVKIWMMAAPYFRGFHK